VHPARGPQLAHPRVDDREAGAPLLPGGQSVRGVVVPHPGELRPEVLPRGFRAREQHVGVELPPGQLLAVRRRALAAVARQVGQHRARVDLAPLEVDRHPRGPVDAGPVAGLGVVAHPVVQELPPAAEGRGLAGLGQLDAVGEGRVGEVGGPRQAQPGVTGGRSDRRPPAVVGPRLRERREDLVRRARAAPHPPGRDGVRRPGPGQLDPRIGQGPLHLQVPTAAVGAVVGGDVDPRRADLPRRQHHPADGVAPDDRKAAAALPQARVEGAQRGGEVGAADRSGGSPQCRVEHEEGEHVAVGAGLEQGRVVPETEVAAKPHHGRHRVPPCHPVPAGGSPNAGGWTDASD
jgi:hypothetical protein